VRKNIAPYDAEKPTSNARRWIALRLGLLALAVGPFVYEGGLVFYARWARLLGKYASVRTPVLDSVGQAIRMGRLNLVSQFHRVPWKPGVVLLIGIASCTACMYLLRGRGSHVE
jgi:hypothetical protein